MISLYRVYFDVIVYPQAIRMTNLLPSIPRRNPEHDFQLLKQVGGGNYGEVYKVRSCEHHQIM